MEARHSCQRAISARTRQDRGHGPAQGNPLEDITLLQNPDNIAAVIKEGEIYTDLLAMIPSQRYRTRYLLETTPYSEDKVAVVTGRPRATRTWKR